MLSEQQVNRAIELYADMIKKICMLHLKNHADTEDIFQTVFLKYMTAPPVFENQEHEKAWLIRVTINACHDLVRSFFRSKTVSLDAVSEQLSELSIPDRDVLEAVLSLPVQYKDVVYLYYYEGYSAVEIAGILHKKVNTIYTLLSRAKALLKKTLGGDDFE